MRATSSPTSTARRLAAGALAAACITGAAWPAHAQQATAALPPAPPPPASTAERWYGWQILLVDAVGLGAMTAGGIPLARSNSGAGAALFYAGFAVSNFSGPVVHVLHSSAGEDSTWKFGVAYALRALLPMTGLLVGYGIGSKAAHCEPRNGCTGGMIAGTIAGSYVASIIDVTALAWEKVPPKPAAPRAAPALLPVNGGLAVGLSGAF